MKQLINFLKLTNDEYTPSQYISDIDENDETMWVDFLENVYFITISLMLCILSAIGSYSLLK
ncbi:MAG: hypothetical protein E7265_08310 [Lachnospiraceae bacterium]|nr:hypothetical protein [Lachnospiraceae bacterium]